MYVPKLEHEEIIVEYLKNAILEGQMYFKAKNIAPKVGLRSHQVGSTISLLREKDTGLKIQAWSGTRAITWRVEKA